MQTSSVGITRSTIRLNMACAERLGTLFSSLSSTSGVSDTEGAVRGG
jgi:hypothetical protein